MQVRPKPWINFESDYDGQTNVEKNQVYIYLLIIFNLKKPDIPFPVFYHLEWNDSGGMTLEKGNDWHVQGDSLDATLRNANNVYTCSVNYFIFGAH